MAVTTVLVRNLGQRDAISTEERDLLEGLPWTVRHVEAGSEFIGAGSRPANSVLVLRGFTARVQLLLSGSRQITAVHLPGDFVDLHGFLLKTMDHAVMALSDCEIATVPHAALHRLTETKPHLTRLLWLSTVIDAAISRAWVAAMGRRSAQAQIAHLVCELYVRLQVVEQAQGRSFRFPVSQGVLGDILGKSTVHVNRALQALRRTGLIRWEAQVVTILDWEGLKTFAEFDPTYLSLQSEPR